MAIIKIITGGSHLKMGRDFGRAARSSVRGLIDESAGYYKKWTKRGRAFLLSYALKNFLPYVRKRYPGYLEEVRGIAEGAGVRFEDLFLLTADEEIVELWGTHEHCSTAAVRSRGRFLLGHNEDYPPRYLGRLVLVEAHPDHGPSFLTLTYPYVLGGPSCGLNGAGLAFAIDSLGFRPRRRGLPTNYILRDLYSCSTVAEAARAMGARPALMGNAATMVATAEHAAAVIEASPDGTAAIAMDRQGSLLHTNHSLSQKLSAKRQRVTENSTGRLAALEKLLAPVSRRSAAGLKAALSSKDDGLRRPRKGPNDSMTIASAVIDPQAKTLALVDRSRREARWVTHTLPRRPAQG